MLHYVTGKVGIKIYEGHSGDGDGVTLNKNAQRCLLLLVQDNVHHPKKIKLITGSPFGLDNVRLIEITLPYINSLSDCSPPYGARLPILKTKGIP